MEGLSTIKKGGKIKTKVLAGFLTVFIITLLILSGPASAITINLTQIFTGDESSTGVYSYEAIVDIHTNDIVPLDFVYIKLTDTNKTNVSNCYYEISSKLLNSTYSDDSGVCENINISSVVNNAAYSTSYGYNYGYGYGYGSIYSEGLNNVSWDYGYGYGANGYGYSSFTENLSTTGEVEIYFTVNSSNSNFSIGNQYNVKAGIAGLEEGEIKYNYYSKNTITFIGRGYDITPPIITIDNLANNTILGAEDMVGGYNITGNVSDYMIGVASTSFYLNGIFQSSVDYSSPWIFWSELWNPSNGVYNLTFRACDLRDNCANASVYGITVDKTAPTYTQVSVGNTVAGQTNSFSIYASDETALHSNGAYIFSTNNTGSWINDSVVLFSTTPSWANVTKTLNAAAGTRVGYRWYFNDSAGNTNSTQIYVLTTTDIINPTFTTIPANASLWYGNQSLSVTFVGADETEFGYYYINDTRFSIAQTGVLTNATPMAVGNYAINVTINDTSNNINWTRYTVQVNKSNYYNCGVYFNETSPLEYPKTFKAWANCTTAFVLTRNGTTITNNTEQTLEVGAYNFSMSRNDTSNYSYIYNETLFRVVDTAVTPSSSGGHSSNSVSNTNLAAGTNKQLSVGETLSFNLLGERHTLKIISIENGLVTIKVSSTPQYATLSVGGEKKFNLNADNFYDLLIKVVSLTTNKVTINLKSIHESMNSYSATPIEEETTPPIEEETNPTETIPETGETITEIEPEPSPVKTKVIFAAIIIILAAIVILTIVLLSDRKQKKKRYYMYGY